MGHSIVFYIKDSFTVPKIIHAYSSDTSTINKNMEKNMEKNIKNIPSIYTSINTTSESSISIADEMQDELLLNEKNYSHNLNNNDSHNQNNTYTNESIEVELSEYLSNITNKTS